MSAESKPLSLAEQLSEKCGGQCAWNRGTWSGKMLSFDCTATDDFGPNDIDQIVGAGNTGGDWDGTGAAVIRLKDGRYVAWESNWGPTGDGFWEDAYGGDADIYFGSTVENVVRFGLTDTGRQLCGLKLEDKA